MSPGQESPVPEGQELHRPSRAERGSREVEQDPGGRGCPQAPGDTDRGTAPRESAPSSLRAAARTAGPGAARVGSGGGSTEGAARPGANPTAQAPEHWSPGHSPESSLPPGQAEAGRAQDSKDAPAPAEHISGPARSLQALQTEFLLELNPGFQSCPATGAVAPGASRGKQPPLSPAPGRGQSSSPKC